MMNAIFIIVINTSYVYYLKKGCVFFNIFLRKNAMDYGSEF